MVDIVAKRPELRETLARVVRLLRYPRSETKEKGSLLLATGA